MTSIPFLVCHTSVLTGHVALQESFDHTFLAFVDFLASKALFVCISLLQFAMYNYLAGNQNAALVTKFTICVRI